MARPRNIAESHRRPSTRRIGHSTSTPGGATIQAMKRALQQKSVFAAVTIAAFVGGALVLTALNVSEWVFFGYIVAVWATLMYALRGRKH